MQASVSSSPELTPHSTLQQRSHLTSWWQAPPDLSSDFTTALGLAGLAAKKDPLVPPEADLIEVALSVLLADVVKYANRGAADPVIHGLGPVRVNDAPSEL